jgi:excisionase family DNA binding protein
MTGYYSRRVGPMHEKMPTPRKEIRLMTVRQAAEYLGTTPATLYTKVWRREIPFIKLGRSVRFDKNDLNELIDDSRVKPRQLSSFRGDHER